MTVGQFHSLLRVPTGALTIPEMDEARALSDRPSGSDIELSVVIPTYNESANVPILVAQLTALLDDELPNAYELIVVDDNSPDRTWEVAADLMADYPQLWVMRRTEERGLSTAVIRGWQAARGRVLAVIDADLQHPPDSILKLYREVVQGADLAVASRHADEGGVSDWSLIRRCLSRGAQLLGLILLPEVLGRVSDPMSGFFMVRRSAIADRQMNPLGYKILLEVIGRGRVGRVAEVGYVFQERNEGESKVTWKQYVDYLRHLARLRLDLWPFGRFLKFGVVGLSGVFVDMTIMYLLGPAGANWGLSSSKLLAGEIAVVNNFIWNDAWTFRDASRSQRGWRKRIRRFLKFNVVCTLGLGLSLVIINLIFNYIIPDRLVANFVAIGITTMWNFWINSKLSWRVTDTKR
jgi:dolichol-phosphate mannosyltransferase